MSREDLGGVPPKTKKSKKPLDEILDQLSANMTGDRSPPKKKEVAEVIIIRESWRDSLISDAGTFVMVIALVGIGILTGSSALQWVGAIMFMICTIMTGIKGYDSRRMTVEEARARLDEIEKDME